ncbi:predicted protein [Botrytis cinerea T4]|uniref:Uncharacterized protein n=1 Tax=Botryotinia fuckeliana (strain T4) TaxID=999810 RepID=G2XW42_BOTF4|nr:predicted protein [Botrytis cinerea T4]
MIVTAPGNNWFLKWSNFNQLIFNFRIVISQSKINNATGLHYAYGISIVLTEFVSLD